MMKGILFAALSSVAMMACMSDAPEEAQGGDQDTAVVDQSVTTFNRIRNKQYQQCVVPTTANINETLRLATCTATSFERWSLVSTGAANTYFLVNKATGLCAEVNNGTATPGERVDQFTCNGSTAEQWIAVPVLGNDGLQYFKFQHAGTNLCLDTVSGSGSNLMQWLCNDANPADAQLWRLETL